MIQLPNTKDPVFRGILKYKNHPSILAIQKCSKNKTFHFEEVSIGEIEKLNLCKKNGILIRIIKENIDIFSEFF